jgi:foldase protein PrsA
VKRGLAALFVVAGLLSGCGPDAQQPPTDSLRASTPSNSAPVQTTDNTHNIVTPTPVAPAAQDEIVASVHGENITMKQLMDPLIQAYGLQMLIQLAQLDLVQQAADRNSVTVSPNDVDAETNITLLRFRTAADQAGAAATGATTEPSTQPSDQVLSSLEHDRLLALLLTSQHYSKADFERAMHRNAILRKLVTPSVQAQLTEDNVRSHFNALYGEKAHVRFVRLPDMIAVAKLEQDLKNGHTFEEETRLHAYDSVGHNTSGELPPFSRQDARYPAEFKTVAFELKPGQVSDPVQIKDAIYLVQLIDLMAPEHANFDDYKDWVKQDLFEQLVQTEIRDTLQAMADTARQTLEIRNPVLRQQWEVNLRNADELRAKLQQDAAAATTLPATAPAAATGAAAATAPSN